MEEPTPRIRPLAHCFLLILHYTLSLLFLSHCSTPCPRPFPSTSLSSLLFPSEGRGHRRLKLVGGSGPSLRTARAPLLGRGEAVLGGGRPGVAGRSLGLWRVRLAGPMQGEGLRGRGRECTLPSHTHPRSPSPPWPLTGPWSPSLPFLKAIIQTNII